jgi:hypothetical protein
MITQLTPMALPFPLSEWDGIAIFEAESYAKFFEVGSWRFLGQVFSYLCF